MGVALLYSQNQVQLYQTCNNQKQGGGGGGGSFTGLPKLGVALGSHFTGLAKTKTKKQKQLQGVTLLDLQKLEKVIFISSPNCLDQLLSNC